MLNTIEWRGEMKKLVVFMIAASLIFASAPAFAAKGQGPGDGGAITKFLNGILGDSWKKGTPDKVVPATSTSTRKTRERIK